MPDNTLIPLPDVLSPEGHTCYAVPVPDSDRHRQIFFAVLEKLAVWVSWEGDNAGSAKIVADRWRDAIDQIEECMAGILDVRQNATLPCKLEKEMAPGVWTQFANLRLCSPLLRLVGSKLQSSVDDGATWQDYNPGNAGTGSNPPPPYPVGTVPPGQSALCLAAQNIVAWFQDVESRIAFALAETATYFQLLTIVIAAVSLLLTGFADAALAGAVVYYVLTISSGDWDAAFTPTVWDDLRCILYCNASSDGHFSAGEYAEIRSEVASRSGITWQWIGLLLDILQQDGLTWAAGIRTTTSADCSLCPCAWCFNMDFRLSDFGWNILHGQYVVGTGYIGEPISGQNDNYISLNLPAGLTITKVTAYYDDEDGWGPQPQPSPIIRGYDAPDTGGSEIFRITANDVGVNLIRSWEGNITTLRSVMLSRISGDTGHNSRYISVQFHGIGTCPFGDPNCT